MPAGAGSGQQPAHHVLFLPLGSGCFCLSFLFILSFSASPCVVHVRLMRNAPPQMVPSLELEALRLSLSNMHTAQLELTQANLQREKETALTELREMLNGRRAQELALLQSRQQHELELMREQHAREKEEMALRSAQETGADHGGHGALAGLLLTH